MEGTPIIKDGNKRKWLATPNRGSNGGTRRLTKVRRLDEKMAGTPLLEQASSAQPAIPRKSQTGPLLESMSVRQLKYLLTSNGHDPSDCIEKADLVEKARRLGLTKTTRPSTVPPLRPSVSVNVANMPPSTSTTTPYLNPAFGPTASVPKASTSTRRSTRKSSTSGAAKRRAGSSRKHSGGKVSPHALAEIVRIEEVCLKNGTCFDILGMSKIGATDVAVKAKAKSLFRYVHPDKINSTAGDIKKRANGVFQAINQAVEDALKSLSVIAEKPTEPSSLTYSVERSGSVIVLRWRPGQCTEQFRVVAGGIDQGSVANLTSDAGELEYAISAQSRSGNDALFARKRFDVLVAGVNGVGESKPVCVVVDLAVASTGPTTTTTSNVQFVRPTTGLKRHHTIC